MYMANAVAEVVVLVVLVVQVVKLFSHLKHEGVYFLSDIVIR